MQEILSEEWRSVAGKFAGLPYEVSTHGQVRSVDRQVGNRVLRGVPLKQKFQRGPGYFCVGIAFGYRKAENIRVHKLVTETFLGHCPEGLCVNHKDANKLNNHISNLEYVTRAENSRHCVRLGGVQFAVGEQIGSSRLTEALVRQIRSDYQAGLGTTRALALKYGVGKSTLHTVIAGHTWKHVSGLNLNT